MEEKERDATKFGKRRRISDQYKQKKTRQKLNVDEQYDEEKDESAAR